MTQILPTQTQTQTQTLPGQARKTSARKAQPSRAQRVQHPKAPTPAAPIRYQPADVARLLGLFPPTEEQAAVIGAPLEPAVVIAGAGSGKTETMAARVVWLVANGLVAPDRIL